jgi:hypothetical protein
MSLRPIACNTIIDAFRWVYSSYNLPVPYYEYNKSYIHTMPLDRISVKLITTPYIKVYLINNFGE